MLRGPDESLRVTTAEGLAVLGHRRRFARDWGWHYQGTAPTIGVAWIRSLSHLLDGAVRQLRSGSHASAAVRILDLGRFK
jgi:hypothetical protein